MLSMYSKKAPTTYYSNFLLSNIIIINDVVSNKFGIFVIMFVAS